jgi:hypothetical protein
MIEQQWQDRRYRTKEVAAIVGVSASDVDNLAGARGPLQPDHQQPGRRRRLWSWINILEVALIRKGLMEWGMFPEDAGFFARKTFRGSRPAWGRIKKGKNVVVVVFKSPFLAEPLRGPNIEIHRKAGKPWSRFAVLEYSDDADLQQQISKLREHDGKPRHQFPVFIVIDVNLLVQRVEERLNFQLATGGIK